MKLRLLSIVTLCLGLSACGVAQIEDRGFRDNEAPWESLKEGVSTKDDVLAALGTPSTESDYGAKSWYYIRNVKETVAFFKPEVISQKVTRITFTDAGLLEKVQDYDLSQSKDIRFVEDITPTEGHKLGVVEQIVGNLGRFNQPADSKKK